MVEGGGSRSRDICVHVLSIVHKQHIKLFFTYVADIDECAEKTAQCEQQCINEPLGYYTCQCDEGYYISENGFSCSGNNNKCSA